jgi:ribosomal protein L18E
MRAEIINGQLVVIPGSETEHYALIHWLAIAAVSISDPARNESTYIRGSMMKISTPVSPTIEPPACAT